MEFTVSVQTANSIEYNLAIIAVASTLLGALVSGVISYYISKQGAKIQKETLELQLNHASLEAHRSERRKVYAEFIDCMERFNILAINVNRFVLGLSKTYKWEVAKGNTVEWEYEKLSFDERKKVDEFRTEKEELWNRWGASWGNLKLVASLEVDRLSHAIFSRMETLLIASWGGEGEEYLASITGGDISPRKLIAEMRIDLGILENDWLDPETGLPNGF